MPATFVQNYPNSYCFRQYGRRHSVVGIQDKTKKIVGLENILQDEERIANAVSDSISPILLPNLQFISYRGKDILIITIPHSPGPFHLKDKGEGNGVYVRVGSTNRIADANMIAEIKRSKEHTSFDQLPELRIGTDYLDLDLSANYLLVLIKLIQRPLLARWNLLSITIMPPIPQRADYFYLEKIVMRYSQILFSD